MRWLLPSLFLGSMIAAEPAVTPARVEDRRVQQLAKTTVQYPEHGELQLIVNVSGFAGRAVHRAGRWHIDEATDDQGTDLRPQAKSSGRNNEELNRVLFDPKKEQDFPIEVELKTPPRSATKLARVRGSLMVLTDGEARTAVFPKLQGLMGLKLDDPALTSAGIRAKVSPQEKGSATNSFTLQLSGNLDALDEGHESGGIDVLDAAGKSAKNSSSGIIRKGEIERELDLDRPVGEILSAGWTKGRRGEIRSEGDGAGGWDNMKGPALTIANAQLAVADLKKHAEFVGSVKCVDDGAQTNRPLAS